MTDLSDIKASLARLETGQTFTNEKLDDLKEVTVTRLKDHTDRVKSLELTRARQRGAAGLVTAIGVVAGVILTFLRLGKV